MPRGRGVRQTMPMAASTLLRDRVRGDVDVLSRAGLGLDAFLGEAIASVRRAVPWAGACVATHDPVTRILTTARKYGELCGRNESDQDFGRIEYGAEELTTFQRLLDAGVRAVGMSIHTGGELERSARMNQLILPEFEFADEVRAMFHDGRRIWGGMALFRAGDDGSFVEEDVAFLAGLSEMFARGVRTGILARIGEDPGASVPGAAVVIVDAADRIAQITPAAHARLAGLAIGDHAGDPFSVIAPLVATARRLAAGESDQMPHARVRTAGGTWLVLHASPLAGGDGRPGEVVVTIEEARPPEIIGLVVAAYDLTPRERDIVQLVIQGVDTKQIAAALHLSAYTVQDHLKSIFDKADVRSRRELIARIYVDQYAPRLGSELAPQGWFA